MLDLHFYTGAQIVSFVLGTSVGIVSFFAQLDMTSNQGWVGLLIQAGMTAVVAILLLRYIPSLMKFQSEERQAFVEALTVQRREHIELVDKIVERYEISLREHRHENAAMLNDVKLSNEKTHKEMQQFLRERGYCPVRDGKEKNL